MRESRIHLKLVEFIKKWIEAEYSDKRVEIIGIDSLIGKNQEPPKINGYIPDIFATCIDTGLHIIGEAETEKGLDLSHTEKQLKAFIDYCLHNNAHLILGVPWDIVPHAKKLMGFYIKECDADGVNLIVPKNFMV